MRVAFIMVAFSGGWLAGYAAGVRYLTRTRPLAILFGLLCAVCFTGFGYTLYHHLFLAGPSDSWTVRRLLAYVITILGVLSFGHLATLARNGRQPRLGQVRERPVVAKDIA